MQEIDSFLDCFKSLKDPRSERNRFYIVKSTQINRHFRLVMPYKLLWQEHIQ